MNEQHKLDAELKEGLVVDFEDGTTAELLHDNVTPDPFQPGLHWFPKEKKWSGTKEVEVLGVFIREGENIVAYKQGDHNLKMSAENFLKFYSRDL